MLSTENTKMYICIPGAHKLKSDGKSNETLMVGSLVITCMGCYWTTKADHQT